jgi:signal transduction histidine kinase/CheY-like chemotaxis protein/HAMP domain-containing protein
MKWFRNSTIQVKLFLSFGALVFMLIAISAFSALQLNNVDKKYSELITTAIGRQSSISKAIKDMNRLRYINLSKGYLANGDMDLDTIVYLCEEHNINVNLLLGHLSDYRNTISADRNLTEGEKLERLEIMNGTISLFTYDYQQKIKELDAALYNANRQEAFRIVGETIPVGDRISEKMDMLYDMVSATVEEISEETTAHSNNAVLLLIGLAAYLIIFSVIVSILMTRNIRMPITQLEGAMLEISRGNLKYPIRNDRTDEIGLLSNQIGDMVDNISEMNKVMTIMGNLDSMVIVIDLDYNLVYINQSLAQAFGVDIENYKGQKCHKALRNYDRPCAICQLPQLLPTKDSFPSLDYEFLYDEAYGEWIGGKAAIIRWVDGSMVYLQYIKNESEKKKSQEQLSEALEAAENASTAKSRFLANMSHELRTPLNVIIGLADLQLEDDDLATDIEGNLSKISNAGHTLLSIVNDILDISKIESGNFMLTPVNYHLASLLNDTITLVTSRIGEKPVVFSMDIREDLPSRLFGDDLRVKQIINNLLSNAIKYTQRGTVELGVDCWQAEDGDDVWMGIRVKDSGIGIRRQDLPKLFSDYNQLDVQINRRIEGTGLGLAITKKLAESMGGDIFVESGYGKGSTFTVHIRQGFVNDVPIGSVVVENLRNFRYHENKRHFASTLVRDDMSFARVLVVDDMQTNLDVAASLLRKYKMQVDCVISGKEAVERIKLGTPFYNAIFMDHMMPEMDGIEAADRIRALGSEYARSIPIIALTANAVVGTEDLFYEHDFQAFVTKPVDIMRLDSVLHQWIKDRPAAKPPKEAPREGPGDATAEARAEAPMDARAGAAKVAPAGAPVNAAKDAPEVPPVDAAKVAPAIAPKAAPAEAPVRDMAILYAPQEEGGSVIEIPGLDTRQGIYRCGGDEKVYFSVLRSFVAGTAAVLEKMRNVTEADLPNYTIAVHGLKGSGATIGAEALRAAAANLEALAKRGDLPGVLAENGAFVKAAQALIGDINDRLGQLGAQNAKPRLTAPNPALLARLRQSCEEYDMESIEEAMDELASASYNIDNDLVNWLSGKIDALEYAAAAERLAELDLPE